MPSVCFVCLGNICRSPMAHAVTAHLIAARRDAGSWLIDSCGTGAWHAGEGPDPRTLAVLARTGIRFAHRARQLVEEDFARFDWLLAMDATNLAVLDARGSASERARVARLGDFDPAGAADVSDPYYGGADGFDRVYEQIHRSCTAFLATIRSD